MRKLVIAMLFCLSANIAVAETIAIIGTGDVGRALGTEFAAQGHTIVYGSRNPDRGAVEKLVEETGNGASATTQAEAIVGADIVVLAIPGGLVAEVTASLGDLSDKIIIDPTNPLERRMMTFKHAVKTSNAEIIQNIAPDADVVKAFNTLDWKTMIDPDEAGGPVTVPLAGNSGEAKEKVAELVEGMGLEALDVGDVENAHWIEGMLVLWINNRYGSMRPSFDFYLRKTQ